MRSVLTVVFVWSMFIPALSAAPASGEAVYKQRCAGCHDSGSGRVPPRDELKKLRVAQILRTAASENATEARPIELAKATWEKLAVLAEQSAPGESKHITAETVAAAIIEQAIGNGVAT